MWFDVLLVSLWGGIVALDTTAALQVMISRPLVACTIVGLLLGNAPVAFLFGILMELVYICELPVGAATFSEGNVGAIVSASLAILLLRETHRLSLILALSLVMAIALSMIGGLLVKKMRSLNVKTYKHLVETKTITVKRVASAQYSGLLLAFSIGFGLTLISILLLYPPLSILIPRIPIQYDPVFKPVGGGLLGAGCAFLLNRVFKNNRYKWLLVIGILAGVLVIYL